jgi:predicted nucleotidyltransferase
MSRTEIEVAIKQLPAQEVSALMAWLERYHAQIWDKQIADDLETGRLDSLLAEVDKEYEMGLAKPL